MPKFSVIVPVRNKEKHLQESIDSVLSQTWSDFELLVLDDASTDCSLEIIERYDDKRLRVVKRNEAGPGGYAARNQGIRMAKGDWVCFLDADDRWLPDHLEGKHRLTLEFPDSHVFTCRWLEEASHGGWECMGFNEAANSKFLTIDDYLRLCVGGNRPINTDVITVRRSWVVGCGLGFPEGKTDRSGDVGLWLKLVVASGGVVAGGFFGAERMITSENRVSRTSEPNPSYFLDLKAEVLSGLSSDCDERLAERYLDSLIGYAAKEARRTGPGVGFVAKHLRSAPKAVFIKALISQALPVSLSMALTRMRRRL